MKLPIQWLSDYLPANLRGAALDEALVAACKRWDLQPASDSAHNLGQLMTFCGFACDAIEGRGHEAVLELDVLSNRPDGQCLLGLAREVAAVLQVPLQTPACDLAGKEAGEPAAALAKITIEEPELCARYTARIIRGVSVGPSPQWLQERLRWMGLQPRNNIVDITNFICFELNQPLHAFDLNTLEGRQIVVRRARPKEPFMPLYGEIPPLTPETLVIADAKNARAVAGVLGGKGSEVTPETRDILLEAAYFNPANTRRTVRRLKVMDGRGTDSSYRFERGIDLDSVDRASARAARLIVELAGGSVAPGMIDVWPCRREALTLALRYTELDRVFGAPVPREAARQALRAVGCVLIEDEPERTVVSVPSWRRGDLEREIDLIEDVSRLYGYNHVPDQTQMRAQVSPRGALEVTNDRLRTLFTALGYFEVLTDSLIDPKWQAPAVWNTQRPLLLDKQSVLREDHAALRNSLLVSLLAVRRLNQDRRTGEARLFEIGKIFLPAQPRAEERSSVALLDDRGFQPLSDLVLRIAGTLELKLAQLKLSVPQKPAPECFAPGQCAQVLSVRQLPGNAHAEDALGWVGVISAELQQAFDLRKPLAMCELNLAVLAGLPSESAKFSKLPEYPEIVRDIAMVVDENVSWGKIESFARNWAQHEPLRDKCEAPRFLSVFRGKQLGQGQKSLAFSVIYRAPDRTLTDEEVNAAHEKFQTAILGQFKATLRK